MCTKLDYALKGELTTDFSCSVYVALVWQNVPHLLMFQRTFCELQWKEILSFAQMSSHVQYHTFFKIYWWPRNSANSLCIFIFLQIPTTYYDRITDFLSGLRLLNLMVCSIYFKFFRFLTFKPCVTLTKMYYPFKQYNKSLILFKQPSKDPFSKHFIMWK